MANQRNKCGQLCIIHGKEVGLYCPHCNEFRCHLCVDSHITSGHIIHACQIQSIIKQRYNAKERETVAQSKSQIAAVFENTLLLLKNNFYGELNKIAPDNKNVNELIAKIHPNVMKVIEEIAMNGAKAQANGEISKAKKTLLALLARVKQIRKVCLTSDNAYQLVSIEKIAKRVKSLKMNVTMLTSIIIASKKAVIDNTLASKVTPKTTKLKAVAITPNTYMQPALAKKNGNEHSISTKLVDFDVLYSTISASFFLANENVLDMFAINEQTIIQFRDHLSKQFELYALH